MNRIIIIAVIFLVIGGYMIATNLGTDFNSKEDMKGFSWAFAKWMLQIGKSTKNVAGAAVQQDWLPKLNETNKTVSIVVE